MSRVTPLRFRDWPPEMRDAMAALMPPNPRHPAPVTKDRPKAENALGTLAHHPSLARAFCTLQGHLLMGTTLSMRHREMLILRTAAVRGSAYEWTHHNFIAPDGGISTEDVARIAFGPTAPYWSDFEAALLRSVDELIHDGQMSDATWATLSSEFGTQQLLDTMFTVTSYDALMRMLKTCQVHLEDDVRELRAQAGLSVDGDGA